MLRFAKLLKRVELRLITYRDGFQVEAARADKFGDEYIERSAVVIINPETAKNFGFKDGQIVRLSSSGVSLNLRLRVSDIAPKDGAVMPKSIYTARLSDKVVIEPSEGEVTKPEDLLGGGDGR